MNLGEYKSPSPLPSPIEGEGVSRTPSPLAGEGKGEGYNLNLADKWIINRLEHTIRDVNQALDTYEFDGTARLLYQFVWRDFCDWYVELSKVHLFEQDKIAQEATRTTLVFVLQAIVKLLHPFMPFITEELWQQLSGEHDNFKSIMIEEFPKSSPNIPYEGEANHLETVKKVIDAIRNIRGEHNIKPQQQIEVTVNIPTDEAKKLLEDHRAYIEDLANLGSFIVAKGAEKTEDVATAIVEDMEIQIPWRGLIDVEAERTRLTKEVTKLESEVEGIKKKLTNESFVSKAPSAIVAQQREKLLASEEKLAKLKEALGKLI
jgi:valyl-tRNA synthetase